MSAGTGIPPVYLERMQRLLGDEYEALLRCYAQPPGSGLRVNTLKLSPEHFKALSPFPLTSIPWCPAGFWLEPETEASPGKHPYHAAGLYYLQDPSAMAVVELLDPQPGELALDLAAAPGGKSTHLAAKLAGKGVLIANETHSKRAWELAQNLERWGVRNSAVLNETPARLADQWGAIFDRVLLDAPCSGEGMFRKSEAARRDWSPEQVASCALRQAGILEEAARLVRAGGRLAYATCTFAPEENEAVIARFLRGHPEFELVETGGIAGAERGRPEWLDDQVMADMPDGVAESLNKTIRLWPHHTTGEGHFIAILQRTGGGSIGKQPRPMRPPRLEKEATQQFLDFYSTTLAEGLGDLTVSQVGSYLYHMPAGMPELNGLKAIHPGLWLGTLKKGRFEPSHALALALGAEHVRQSLALTPPEALSYLQGNTLTKSGTDGWMPMTMDGFPLGWGKRAQGVIKNFYPKGLRW